MSQYLIYIVIDLHIDKKGLACSERRKRRAVPFWASSPCGFEDGTCVNWMKWRWMIYCELNPLLYKDGDKSDGPDLLFSCRARTHSHTHSCCSSEISLNRSVLEGLRRNSAMHNCSHLHITEHGHRKFSSVWTLCVCVCVCISLNVQK